MQWTPNKVTALRVAVGFAAVSLFGRGPWTNLAAVGLTVAAIALDALDGHLARRKNLATPVGAQIDILGDRMIENVYFTYFAVVGMVSLWLPVFFFARGAATDFLRGLAMRAGHSGWGANAMLQTWVGSSAGSLALEPRFVCGHEMLVFLLPRNGVGADARARGAAGSNDRGFACVGARRRSCAYVDDGGVLFVAWIAGAGRRAGAFYRALGQALRA